MKKSLLFFALFAVFPVFLFSQVTVQTVKGRVTDAFSGAPLPAIYVIVNSEGYLATYTDDQGYYNIPKVPVGKFNIIFSSMGFETVAMSDITINSGKEVVLNVKMQENILSLQEITVTAERDRIKLINEMSGAGGRNFTIEDATRYAGSMNDISRMVQNLPGVGTPDDSSNDIVVRGNSPFGLLWRVEGVDIYNPNHFSDGGSTGGPISMLNVNTLETSSFYTSAFAAEYMNAYSGVFDVKLRNGNYDNYEFTGQVGINGFEADVEGPFSKKSKASFLATYRYSFLDLLALMGFNFGAGTAMPRYQDYTVKINVPTKKSGNFSVFSLGGNGNVNIEGGSSFYNYADNIVSSSGMYVVGAKHEMQFGPKHSYSFIFAASTSKFSASIDTLNPVSFKKELSQSALLQREFVSAQLNYKCKVSPKLSIASGFTGKRLAYKFVAYDYAQVTYPMDVNEIGHTYQLQAFVEGVYRPKKWLTINGGVNAQFLFLNRSYNIDPRFSMTFRVKKKHEFSLGYGLHSQFQGLEIYMTKLFSQSVESNIYPNKYLKMIRSHHFVAGYEWRISEHTHFKAEAYYQYLYNIPVDLYESYYALTNLGGLDFSKYGRIYVSQATGQNYGLELSIERIISKGWYYLGTLSLFQSHFTSLDGIVRNTAHNNNYVTNALIGKEFNLTKQNAGRKNLWSVGGDVKFAGAGGQRYIPVDIEASRKQGTTVYNYLQAYKPQLPYYMRIDIKVYCKINQRHLTHELGVEIRNISDRKNVYSYGYDHSVGDMVTTYQNGMLPLGYYRITF